MGCDLLRAPLEAGLGLDLDAQLRVGLQLRPVAARPLAGSVVGEADIADALVVLEHVVAQFPARCSARHLCRVWADF